MGAMDPKYIEGYAGAWDAFVDGKMKPTDYLSRKIKPKDGTSIETQTANLARRHAARDYVLLRGSEA